MASDRRRRRLLWFRLVALLIALVLGGLAGELLVRLLAPQDLTGSFRVQSPKRGQLINRAGGQARHQKGERVVEYRFNAHHLRGPALRERGRRVLLLGDSFTFGVLLAEQDTLAPRLQGRADEAFGAQRLQILNGGVSGFGLANMVALVEEFGESLRPELVVVMFNGGDVQRSALSGLYTRDPATGELRSHDLPRRRLKDVANAIPGWGWLVEHSHLVQLLRGAAVGRPPAAADEGPPPAPDPDEPVLLAGALFDRLHAWCDAREIDLVVLTTGFQDSPHFGAQRYPSLRFLASAPVFFEARSIPFSDLAPALLEAAGGSLESVSIPGDGHPNEEGARLMAELAWPALESHLARVARRPR